ncbi:1191_t:CDS:2 [Ambispora gerdemannii]|uniref:1191_t:CDS:1 n=1 Tax=Ambispora gerdemannii TaxID=144530 RepID=A0A9N8YMH1_9GLOM|nr:1191_t:CDS:2 [Ambispora gerdemannii]
MAQAGGAASLVTQAVPMQAPQMPEPGYPSKLTLELRGQRFEIDREMLMSLPESILIVMFPNGLILGRGAGLDPYEDDEEAGDDASDDSILLEDQTIYVDFDPQCLEYILNFYRKAQDVFYSNQGSSMSTFPSNPTQNPLLNKQAIIVLREELDYFTIPPKKTSSDNVAADGSSTTTTAATTSTTTVTESTLTSLSVNKLKIECGEHLLNQRKIFTALQRNVNKENNVAEQHLIDMLCVSGFSRDDEWGYRNIEPLKTSIVSIALVMLKTTGQSNQMATAQKLLLFWRKPARKCWWDGLEVNLGVAKNIPVSLWCRRTWTLELALV